MIATVQRPPPPSSDKRWKIVETTMRRHGYAGNSLIESLHSAQEAFGFLDDSALRFVAGTLHVPLSRVYGVATFYHYFTLKPQGRHSCVVCTGTACYVKGASDLIASVQNEYKVKPGETTKDGELSLLTARCIGSCGLAPAAVIDGEVLGRLDRTQVLKRIQQLVNHHDG
jgi:bidirectional [NiFe] hydrogenase diaphorase subunit